MKLLFASIFFTAALFAAATTVPPSPSMNYAATAGMGSLHDLHHTIDTNNLPNEDLEDMSLVYSNNH
ncbi:hypothetical protein [Bradyrhizobium nanningense]|uniref:hypothetical protein n=1 Tax=Bradyrhizobium nanningense TaxID=1325118 RepID=UPI001008AA27|nr:hypothetical protein [Bradyrhizobium nanningense]